MPDSQPSPLPAAAPVAPAAGSIRWQFAPAAPPALRPLLTAGRWLTAADRATRKKKRSILHLPPGPGLPGLYIKHDHPGSVRDWVKSLWRCKSAAEFEAGLALAVAGIGVVPMLAWGRHGADSWLVSADQPGAIPFRTAWRQVHALPAPRRRFLAALAAFLAQLARAGVRHPDLHAGNLLVTAPESAPAFLLVDVYGVRVGPPARSPAPLLLWLGQFLRQLDGAEQDAFLLATGAASTPAALPPCRTWLWREINRAEARRWPGRRVRWLAAGSLVERHTTADGTWTCVRGFPVARATACLAQHRATLAADRELLKSKARHSLTRVRDGDGAFVVQEFRRPGPFGRWGADARAWLTLHRLAGRGFAVPRAQAWLRDRDGHGYLLLEDVGTRTLLDALAHPDTPAERARLAAAAGRLLAELHAAAVFPATLTPDALWLRPAAQPGAAPVIVLTEAAGVRFGTRLDTPRRRAAALACLLGGLPAGLPRSTLLRGLAAYRRAARVSRPACRALLREPVAAARARCSTAVCALY